MKSITALNIILFIILFNYTCVSHADKNTFKLKPAVNKKFSYITNIKYKEKTYVENKILLLSSPIIFNEGPDRELVSFLSAIHNNDYKWWLNIWDINSKELFKNNQKINDRALNKYFNDLKKVDLESSVKLTKWIVFGKTVLVGFSAKDKESNVGRDLLVPFILEDGKWKITWQYLHSEELELLSRQVLSK